VNAAEQPERMRLVVDLTRCQGYGQCVFAAPEVFRMPGAEALLYESNPADEQREKILRAAAVCPVRAIVVDHAAGERAAVASGCSPTRHRTGPIPCSTARPTCPSDSTASGPPAKPASPGVILLRHADDSPGERKVTALTAPSAAGKPTGAAPAQLPAEPLPQPGQAFMSALVTEHFVLQSARSTTVSEAVGRAAVYLTCVSSSLVAFGFFAAATHRLAPVVATVLPALIILGVFTFVRLVETSVENLVFLRRIEAIRRYYVTLDPAAAAFFASADGEAATALASTGMRANVTEMFFTGASMVAAVTGILAGAGAALLLDAARVPAPAAVIAGVAAALLAFGLQMLWMYRRGQPAMA